MTQETKVDAREVAALTDEARQYAAVEMWDRVALVNEQLKLRGAPELEVPKRARGVDTQTRQSSQAATRRKATAK